MDIRKFNISKPRKYTTRDGGEKTAWDNIGTMTEFHKDDGSVSRKIEIPAIALDAQVFPFKEQGASSAPRGTGAPAKTDWGAFNDDINPEDIPF